MLCAYKDLFGAPNTGVHAYRVFNLAIVDVAATVAGAYLIHRGTRVGFAFVLGLLVLAGIVLHDVFCVRTMISLERLRELTIPGSGLPGTFSRESSSGEW